MDVMQLVYSTVENIAPSGSSTNKISILTYYKKLIN